MESEGYTREEVLGQGAFSTVYKATFTHTCAVKVIDISGLKDQEKAAKKKEWKEKIESLMKVRGHVNVVEYRNSFVTYDDKLWLELEYCSGGTLNDYAIEKNPGREIKHRFLLEISSAIAYLHSRGIEHCDLKPVNILILIDDYSQPHCKVADFGLTKMLADCNYDGKVLRYYLAAGCGTEFFIAPEVYKGLYYYNDKKVDIFAMGIIFRSMVPYICWKEIGSKKYLLEEVDGSPCGKVMMQSNTNIVYDDSVHDQINKKVRSLLDSMIQFDYYARPSAADVYAILKSITPRDLSTLTMTSSISIA